MKILSIAFLGLFLTYSSTLAADVKAGLHGESEAGIVVATGNTRSNTFNLKHQNTYRWSDSHLLKLDAALLRTTAAGVQSARSHSLGLRYEEQLTDRFSLYAGQNLESDVFAGYLQRYNSDVGAKYQVFQEELDGVNVNAEGGYRYTIENRAAGGQSLKNVLRLFSEATKSLNKSVSAKLTAEYLPNLASFSDYRLNSELSVAALLNDVFSIKTGYLVKYINEPLPGVPVKTDTIFTTALVAKF